MKIPSEPKVPRITWRLVMQELLAQLNLEKGLGYTLKKLCLVPGDVVEEYLFRDRKRITRPVPLLLLTTAVATLVSFQVVPSESELLARLTEDPEFVQLPKILQRTVELATYAFFRYFNLLYLSSLPVMAFATWLVLPKGLTGAEHFVVNSYLLAFQTVIYVSCLPLLWVHPCAESRGGNVRTGGCVESNEKLVIRV